VPGSYLHNSKHRLLTANGWFQLPSDLDNLLQQRLRALFD
jgi:hypothetical protein